MTAANPNRITRPTAAELRHARAMAAAARAMQGQGLSMVEIAERLGVQRALLYRWLRKHPE